MRQRYYNTDIKRFINQDILTGSITDSQSLNRYSYVEGNPVSFLDPFGLSKLHNTIASIRGAYNIIHKALADPFYVVNNAIRGAVHIWRNIDEHTKLNILGTLPVIGYVFDIANAISYFKDGNVEQGIESLIFALPTLNIAGGAGTIAKLFTSSQKTADAVGNALQLIGSATAAFTATAKMGNGIADIIDTYLTGGADIDENFIAKAAEVFSYALMTSVFGSMAIKDARAYLNAAELIDELKVFENEIEVKNEDVDTYGMIDGKTPASRLADKAQKLPNSKRPNTVAVIRTADGRYYIGYNKAGFDNDEVQEIMNVLGNSNIFNRQCAEVNAISRALNKGANLEGATISVANVRSIGNYSGLHGTSKPPCDVCQPLLDYYGIKIIE